MSRKIYLPLFVIEVYLLFSLLLMIIGPLHFELENKLQFTILMIMYHIAFVFGYLFGGKVKTGERSDVFAGDDYRVVKRFTILIIAVFYVWIIVTRNNTHASSYIPTELFKKAIQGIINPASRYNSNKGTDAMNLFNGNKLMTGSVLPIYFLYYCFPALTVLYWKKITKIQKVFSVILIFLYQLQGFATGINSVMFHVIFALAGGIIIKLFTENKFDEFVYRFNSNKKKKRAIITITIVLILGITYFVHNISTRLNGNELAYFQSKSTDITISSAYDGLLDNPVTAPLVSSLASIESYLCQGYYGMSLAIDEPFTSTYGLGHSFFLATSLDNMFGTNVIANTYQEKITSIWSRTVNWHSFYSQMANDVGFYGVIFVMFILGMIVCMVWKDVLIINNPVAKLFLIVLIPVFIFMPMNNQMGNLYGTFFSFWELFILWIITRRYRIVAGKISI